MSYSGNKSSSLPIPPRWLHCPRKSLELIAGKFLAFKTPLDTRYDSQVPAEHRFPPSMIFDIMKSYKVKIGLWIDLCNTSRFYDKDYVESKGCTYTKLRCRGHGETPSEEQVKQFNYICRTFIQKNPLDVIGVHCTHGFNRTGFLISAFLIENNDWDPQAALATFSKGRPPGIYKEDYIEELFRRFGEVTDAPAVPDRPDWCFEEDEERGVDEDGNPLQPAENGSGPDQAKDGGSRNRFSKKAGKFMEGVPGVSVVTDHSVVQSVQRKAQKMCGWKRSGFPGSQPVSMDRKNINKLAEKSYQVSWKADGTRYMMLIDGQNQIFFIDRDNCVYQVSNITFLHRKMPNKHLTETLLDGEMVIDEFQGQKQPRYLIYDIIRFEGVEVGKTNFNTRHICINKEIIETRKRYTEEGKIDRASEPFSIRKKQFWDLSGIKTLLGPKFTKESLGHEPDGLIFQPADDPYIAGTDENVLKWKPHTHNSVDFKLQVVREDRPGMLPSTIGRLYVGGLEAPFDEMRKLKKGLKELHNKIIECTWDAEKNQWAFMRERTDKSFPNAYSTAMSVIESIRSPVTAEMLLDFVDRNQFRRPFMPAPSGPPPKKIQRLEHSV